MKAIKIKIALPVGLTQDYDALRNKPKINDVTLEGNKTSEDLHLTSDETFETFKQQVDEDLDKKLDKVTDITVYQAAYVTKRDGSQSTVEISYPSKGNTIPIRNRDGSISGIQNELTSSSDLTINSLYTRAGLWLKALKLIDGKSYVSQTMLTDKGRVDLCFLKDASLPYNVIFQSKKGTVAYIEDVNAETSAREQADNALQSSINDKLNASAVVQETGTAEDKVISQKVVTKKLNGKLDVNRDSKQCVYAVNQVREQEMVKYSEYVYPFSIAYRNENGELAVADATLNESAVSLGQLIAKLLGYLPTSGGTITNDLAIQGNLTVRGTTTTTKEETLNVKDAIVVTNADGADLSATLAGFVIRLNATDCYGIMYDKSSDSVKLGLGTIADGKFVFYEGEGNAVAVRADGSLMSNGHLVKWDATALKFVDAGKSVDDIKSDTLAALTEGDNISITKASDSEKVTISATGLVKQVRVQTGSLNNAYVYDASAKIDKTIPIICGDTTANTIVLRNARGAAKVFDPIDNFDAVNKQYFEANAVMQRITYSSDNKTISPTELALLKPGFYTINTSYTITNGTDSLPKDYYTMIKQGGIDDVPYNDSTYLFQSYGGTVYAYSQYGSSGYENKSAFYKLATTSDVATATAVLIDNSLLGG